MRNALNILIILLSTTFTFAEGTKELRPAESNFGNLFLSKSANFTKFGHYGAPVEQQIKIRVSSTDETIYFGFNNHFQNGDFVAGLPYRIVSPSGVVVFESTTQAAGEGYIENYNQAVTGPAELGNANGYNAIAINPTEIGDYILEFDVEAITSTTEIHLHLFDVTVADAANQPISGRLHSQGWQLSTEGGSNPFNGKVYPYDKNGIVYEVDFNQMQPYSFVINFNSKGTGTSGDFLIDRQSKIGNHTFPEYEVFLNPPDPNIYPTVDKTVTFQGEVKRTDCMKAQFCLSYTSNSDGFLEGFVDVNGTNIYEEGIDLLFYDFFATGQSKCIDWDGTDASGNPVDEQKIKIFSSFGFGVTHLPLYDVEHNPNGYKVKVISPNNIPDPLIFWDDRNISNGTALDGLENLTGCSSATDGCHKWEDRGNNSNPETINSWWYTKVLYDTLVIESMTENPVDLSFHPDNLVKGDSIVCKGDSLRFYVYNDGKSHFDTLAYTYNWSINSIPVGVNIREQKLAISGPSEIVIKSTDLTNPLCISYDTLFADVVEPVKLTAQIENANCGASDGSISITLLSSPPNPLYTWGDPALSGNTITNLSEGIYNLHVEDPSFSSSCALDTSFQVISSPPIEIDNLALTPTLCYEAKGAASVTMKDPAEPYEYSWNSGTYTTQSSIQNLAAGTHSLLVRNSVTMCMDDTTFEIEDLPFTISATTEPEVCKNAEGLISLTLPVADFDVIWNGTTTKNTSLSAIQAGNYSISVISTYETTCRFDTVIPLENIEQPVIIEDILLQNIICGIPGSAEIVMPSDGRSYQFSWNGGTYSVNNSQNNLAEGPYSVSVIEAGTTCQTDTSFVLNATYPLEIKTVTTTPSECYAPTGSAAITMKDAGENYEYSWDGSAFTNASDISALPTGTYTAHVRDAVTGCTDDTTFMIPVLPFQVQLQSGPEVCSDGEGWIEITTPAADFDFYIEGAFSADSVFQNLTAGTYDLSVISLYSNTCRVDTVAEVLSESDKVRISDLILGQVICGAPTGSAEVEVPSTGISYEFSWNNGSFGNINQISGLSQGQYNLSVIVPGTSCRLDTTFEITGSEPIEINGVPTTDTKCYEAAGTASVIMADPSQPYEYSWNSQSFVPDSFITDLTEGQHAILVQNPLTGCKDDTIFRINPLPFTISFTKTNEFCSAANGSVALLIPEGNFMILSEGVEVNNPITNLSAGSYNLSVVAKNNNQCRVDTTTSLVNELYTVPADFTYVSTGYNQLMETESLIQFTNTSPGLIAYSDWDMGDGSNYTLHDPSHAYSTEGTYTVTLTVADSNGCTGMTQKIVSLTKKVPCGIALPNAFTPNFDQKNDNIGVLGYAETIDLKIFNRWGEVIFRTLKTEEKWDGTYRGEESPVGVYPFIIEYECPDENNRLIKKSEVGAITLIR